ncbi:MAG: metal ABC transporter substrate-binding protein [Candidatus Kariarchaeaceae archaeon]|jgi:manganese/zinc/iron transport system substrate-binding protein
MRKQLVLLLLLFSLSNVSALQVNQEAPLNILATTAIVGDIVKEIGGDLVDVSILIGPGVDPHDYEPSVDDGIALQNADFVFFSGGGLEERLDDTLELLEEQGNAISFLELIPEEFHIDGDGAHSHEEDDHTDEGGAHSGDDPHFWHDPVIMRFAIDEVAHVLTDLDLDRGLSNGGTYLLQGAQYTEELLELHASIEEQVNLLNETQRFLVTEHQSFSYWAQRYGFETLSLEGISTSDDAGIAEIEELASEIIEHEIQVIFTESSGTPDGIEAVMRETEARGWKIAIGGQLLSGTLDETHSTYLAMMEYNANVITSSILSPPEGVGSFEAPVHLPIAGFLLMAIIRRRTT